LIPVIAHAGIRRVGTSCVRIAIIIRTDIAIITNHWEVSKTLGFRTDITGSTSIVIITDGPIQIHGLTTQPCVAKSHRTGISVFTIDRSASTATSITAQIIFRAEIPIVAGSRIGGIHTAIGRITAVIGAGIAIIAVHDSRGADPVRTGVWPGTRIAIVTDISTGRTMLAPLRGSAEVVGAGIVVITIQIGSTETIPV